MEYLPRTHRHLNRVSEYDVMAIAYGYLGKQPEHLDWFCTDDDQGAFDYRNSAECSNADATDDPISFFESRINRGLDLLLARGSADAPEWTINEVVSTMAPVIHMMSAYAYTAPTSAGRWTNFFGKPGRPADAAEVPKYILGKLNRLVCGMELEASVLEKTTVEAQSKTIENLTAFRYLTFEVLKQVPSPWSFVSPAHFSCVTPFLTTAI